MNNNENKEIDSILYMLKPLIVIENWFGKFRYRKVNGQITILSRRMKLYGIFVVLILIVPYIVYFVNLLLNTDLSITRNVIELVDELVTVIMIVQHIISMAIFLSYSKNNIRIIKEIAHIDEILNKSTDKKGYKKFRTRLQFQIFIFVSVLLMMCIFTMINRDDQDIKITLLAKAYVVIGETNELINKVFQFHIFKSLTSTFIYIIIIIWTSIYYLRISNNTEFLIRIILFCIFEIMSIGIMSYACESIHLKRNSIKILVNELIMDYDLSPALRIEAKAFTEVIQVWPLHIFVYDMFSIDIKLIVKFISVSTTYLIIIVQLSHFF
ncbi:uncharacterized protein LOC125067063 [Vanessa atalanta]|uniref:uncharacterized protein LOC125067063 n=1 Tax=Vanessa atalanta TaxID=42275 RepID=UPI001FCCDD0A|nr:uncharacterized protein LOC125067063 [Vanessa atalanta]